ncbi:MAG: hypothetical protein IJW16_02125 [Clostridia bacterium]|nr:hypothetical protein [Clostridia bacterium]
MKLSQLTCRMDKEEKIIVMGADLPVDRNVLHYGLVREIPRDAPWACAFVSHVCAYRDIIVAEVKTEDRRR